LPFRAANDEQGKAHLVHPRKPLYKKGKVLQNRKKGKRTRSARKTEKGKRKKNHEVYTPTKQLKKKGQGKR